MKSKKDMKKERSGFGIVYDNHDKQIYVFGGCDKDFKVLKRCEKYCIKNNKWIEIASMKIEKVGSSVCILNNQFIYIIGGFNDECLNDI